MVPLLCASEVDRLDDSGLALEVPSKGLRPNQLGLGSCPLLDNMKSSRTCSDLRGRGGFKSLRLGGNLLPGGSNSSQRERGPRRASFITSIHVRVETLPKFVSNSACPICRAVTILVDGSISARCSS
jgi:hypothetical protein